MRRPKYRTARLFHIALWSVMFIISINLLIKCIRIFGADSSNQSTQSLETNVVTVASNYLIQSNIPIMNYITDQDNNENNNVILNTIAGVFPINRYVAEAKDNIQDNLIEEQNDSILFANGSSLLFDKDVYLALILKQKNSVKDGQDELENSETITYNNINNNSSTDNENSLATSGNSTNVMPIDIISGEVYLEQEDATNPDIKTDSNHDAKETLGTVNGEYFTLDQLLNRQFLYNNFYIIDSATVVNDELFDAEVLLGKDMTMKATSDKPQILIYHTHSQEAFSDSKKGVEEDTIVGVGTYLTKLLTEKYGYNVIHDKSQYDLMEGYLERNLAYNHAAVGVANILEENPTIEIVIDIHRDGVNNPEDKRVAKINGKDAAQIMLFNGLSRNSKGQIASLKNSYLKDNLAFSLQTQLKGREIYPGLMYKNYLHAYRYNMHLRKKSLLLEVGTNQNTIEEEMNAIELFADVLYEIINGES